MRYVESIDPPDQFVTASKCLSVRNKGRSPMPRGEAQALWADLMRANCHDYPGGVEAWLSAVRMARADIRDERP